MEGDTDKSVIPYLMEANGVKWPDRRYPEPYGGVDEVLKPGVIESELRVSGLEALGLVVDANGHADARWDQLRALCDSEFADLPDRIPAEGLETVHSVGARFGVWIMPDNSVQGNAGGSARPTGSRRFQRSVRNGTELRRYGEKQRSAIQGCTRAKSRDLHVARVAEPTGTSIA